ncbi:MAG: EAL domain-containing protein, partial [Actinomycetota bacterium]
GAAHRAAGIAIPAGLAGAALAAALLSWRLHRRRRLPELRAREAEVRRRAEARHRSLARDTTDIVTVVDGDGRIREAGAATENVLGHAPARLIGTPLTDLVHPADADRLRAALPPRAADAPDVVELRLRHRDGTWHHTETTVTDLRHDPDVAGVVVTSRNVAERKALQERLAHQALHDGLTGLANRALLIDRLEHALRRQPPGERLAVLIVDLDDFRSVNDSLGHAIGDAVLVTAATRLRGIVRPADTVARHGGDEFAILVEGVTAMGDVERLADRLIATLEEPVDVDGHELRARASVGVVLSGGDAATAEDILRNADVAMHAAKTAGKARFAVFTPDMHAAILERHDLAEALRRAIDGGELRVRYQPIVDLADGHIVGTEALVRWQHPERGLVSPAAFIPLAEETGLIVPLGRWVLDTACRQMGRWHREAPADPPLRLSVNLSERQLHDVQLVADVEDALRDSGLDPSCLVLELTESALIEERGDTVARLNALKSLGVRLAVDDFGVGYSSLRYLHRLPVDELKVDKSFVDHVDEGREQAALAEAIIAIGHRLSLETVAEGIETPDQVDALRSLGCEMGQGYRFATPLTAAEMSDLLAAERSGEPVWAEPAAPATRGAAPGR